MRRLLRGLLLLALALAAVVVVRTARMGSRQPETRSFEPVFVEGQRVAERLAGGVRFATVASQDPAEQDAPAFRGFHRHLEASYPRVHRSLARETVDDFSLLYTWRGRDPSLPPVLLAAHIDVVPVDAGSADDWTHPPFDGVVADGYVWGRGTLDDKGSLFCILEAVEALLAERFRPERSVLLAFGHDEEVGGERGAGGIARLLGERGVRLAFALDEGGMLLESGTISGLERPVAAIGVAEKGFVSIALDAVGEGGHSSVPPRSTAVGAVAAAVAALERSPMPARIDGTTALFFDHVGPELPFAFRAVLANRWLFGPLLEWTLATSPPTDAMIRTTTAATMLDGGVKENVLPIRARAVVNFRIHPADSVAAVVEHVESVVDDPRISLQVGLRSEPREPSEVSPVDSEAFVEIATAARETLPDAVAVPFLVLGGTDVRHYAGLTPRLYRFLPFELGRDAQKRIHGTDERISVENLVSGVRFYRRLLERAVGPAAGP